MKCNKCGYNDNGTGDTAYVCGPIKIKEEEEEEDSLHWHALNYRTASTQNAHEMWLRLEAYVAKISQK